MTKMTCKDVQISMAGSIQADTHPDAMDNDGVELTRLV